MGDGREGVAAGLSGAENARMAEPYEVVPDPPTPRLPGAVMLHPTIDDVIDAVTADLLVQAKNCVRSFGDFHAVLSGSPALEPIYRRLMYDPGLRDLPWKQTHLWLADEAHPTAEERTPRFALIRDWLIEHSDIPPEQVHGIVVDDPDPAARFRREASSALAWRASGHDRFDFVLLSVEGGGLLPLHARDAEAVIAPIAPDSGLGVAWSVTDLAVAQSRFLASIALGASAARVLRDTRADAWARLAPAAGEWRWYMDHDTAARTLAGEADAPGSAAPDRSA